MLRGGGRGCFVAQGARYHTATGRVGRQSRPARVVAGCAAARRFPLQSARGRGASGAAVAPHLSGPRKPVMTRIPPINDTMDPERNIVPDGFDPNAIGSG